MEGPAQHQRIKTNQGGQLLGNLHTSSLLAHHMTDPHAVNHEGLAYMKIDFVMAYTQAEVETDTLYMQVPTGYDLPKEKKGTHILKILRNIYGQKQVG